MTKLLSILQNLQKMLLFDKDTSLCDMAWSGLERMAEAALKILTHTKGSINTSSEEGGLHWGGKEHGHSSRSGSWVLSRSVSCNRTHIPTDCA